jgi:uncharacterized membrane protein YbaN (DUF454 family)
VTRRTKKVRWGWTAAGIAALVLGLAGIALPVLPTIPFLIVAADCFSRGNRRWERWLLSRRKVGPLIRDWREHHAVPLPAKVVGTAMMGVSCAVTWVAAHGKQAWIPTVLCAGATIWLWRLPTRRK